MKFDMHSMSKKIWIFGTLITLLCLISLAIYSNQDGSSFRDEETSKESIGSFMNDAGLDLSNQGIKHPSNFSVGAYEQLVNGVQGEGRMVIPKEWERNVYLFEQNNLTKDCQVYSYEVDTHSGKVVQVQLAGNPPVGSELQEAKAKCEQLNPLRQITAEEAETIAFDYIRKNVPDLSATKANITAEQGDRYIYTWEDKNYVLPEGLTSEPWPYPTIRVILDKQGRLMSYLNTTFFFYK
jgi:hypothetical protein